MGRMLTTPRSARRGAGGHGQPSHHAGGSHP